MGPLINWAPVSRQGPSPPPPPGAGASGGRASIVEIKRTLAGREKRFACQVLRRDDAHLVVLFVAPEAMHVHGVDLPAGTVTFGHFWANRPYNVYHWLVPATGATIGYYLNVSDGARLGKDVLEWTDLIVDVLLLPGAAPRVLDEDELPPDLDEVTRARIAAATRRLIADVPALAVELEQIRDELWSAVAPAAVAPAAPP